LAEVARPQLDWRAVRGSRARAAPSLSGVGQHARVGKAFCGNDAFERGEPMVVIGLAGVGIAGGLRLLDLVAESGGPFRPGKQAALFERQRERERCRLPGLAEYRPFGIARN